MAHDGPQPTYELSVCYLIVGLLSDQPSDFLRDEELYISMMLIQCPEILAEPDWPWQIATWLHDGRELCTVFT